MKQNASYLQLVTEIVVYPNEYYHDHLNFSIRRGEKLAVGRERMGASALKNDRVEGKQL